ncbi:MAG: hypothetical protein WDM77_08725 [Steroidobacteraceae bacterium]
MVMGPTPPGTGVMAEAFCPHAFEVDITHDAAVGQTIDAHVDHDRARAHHLRHDQAGNAGRHHQDVGQHRELTQIAGLLVADAHRRLLLHEHECHRLADDIAGAPTTTTLRPSTGGFFRDRGFSTRHRVCMAGIPCCR